MKLRELHGVLWAKRVSFSFRDKKSLIDVSGRDAIDRVITENPDREVIHIGELERGALWVELI